MGNEFIWEEERKKYFKTEKFIRDLVHGYVYLTNYELELIDTTEFQRLKDIRQLTCQHIYPAARHTRFEHSLGVLELTRQAVTHLNKNGIISTNEKNIFNEDLQFNVAIAALLHDVGHCPFSHLGEKEFDKDEVWERLFSNVESKLSNTELHKFFCSLNKNNKKKPGAIHEQISCIVILEKYYDIINNVKSQTENNLHPDFELIIRCILGIEYATTSELFNTSHEKYSENLKKNTMVNLINSSVFDMDKLDYIMRDSYMTGIGTPKIDTLRLFRNMYLNKEYSIIFTSRAVPALQNMIDARDELYMYVYNHHAVVFSDYLNSYIFRRLSHNSLKLDSFINKIIQNEVPKIKNDPNVNTEKMTIEMIITNLV